MHMTKLMIKFFYSSLFIDIAYDSNKYLYPDEKNVRRDMNELD